jgi:hypothetical protein
MSWTSIPDGLAWLSRAEASEFTRKIEFIEVF